ncbi:MAG: NCS2 family permease [Ignavibacteriales bacterium]
MIEGEISLADVLAAIAVVINGLPQGLLALSYGFGAFPTALGFAVGVVGALLFGSVAPISFQAESIVLAGTMGCNRYERCTIVVICGLAMAAVGAFGLLQPTIAFIGPAIESGMMAGVGIILATVAINMVKSNAKVGVVSVAVALLVYAFKKDLVWTIVASVVASTVLWLAVRPKTGPQGQGSTADTEVIKAIPLTFNPQVIRGALAMICLQIGGNIAYAGITGNIAKTPVNVDRVTLYSGLADAASAFFGGGPVEAIISGTGAAPRPLLAGVLMMGIMAVILLLKLLPTIGKHVPSESIAGFLFVLGAIVVFPVNVKAAIGADAVVGGVTTVVTAATDPFIGLIAGVIIRTLMGTIGG